MRLQKQRRLARKLMLTSRLPAKARASRPTRREHLRPRRSEVGACDLSVYGTLSDGRRVPVGTGARFRARAWPWPASRHLERANDDDTNANRVHRTAAGVRDGIPG